MKAETRRKLEMAKRALDFSRAHPDASPGYTAALTRLEQSVARAEQLAKQYREGINQVRAATSRKGKLRRSMWQAHLRHLVRVAKIAQNEAPDLAKTFSLPPDLLPYSAFQTAAHSLAAEAASRKELLEKHGLSNTLLEALDKTLDEFDQAMQEGSEGRAAHVGARAKLETIANEVVQIVRVLDALNRFRFAEDAELMAAWESISNVLGPARRANGSETEPEPTPGTEGEPNAGGEVKPAA
jgi:uncharacterized protein YicC (UPF0701 family)